MTDAVQRLYDESLTEEQALEEFKKFNPEQMEEFILACENRFVSSSVTLAMEDDEDEVSFEQIEKRAAEYQEQKRAMHDDVVQLWSSVANEVRKKIAGDIASGYRKRYPSLYLEHLRKILSTRESKALAWLDDENILVSIQEHFDELEQSEPSLDQVCEEIKSFIEAQILEGFAFSKDFLSEKMEIKKNFSTANADNLLHVSFQILRENTIKMWHIEDMRLGVEKKEQVTLTTIFQAKPASAGAWVEAIERKSTQEASEINHCTLAESIKLNILSKPEEKTKKKSGKAYKYTGESH